MEKTNYFILLVSALLIFSTLTAQTDSSGIYKTAEDFQNRKLAYAINYKTEMHKINADLLFNDKEVKVKHHDTTYKLLKSNTYGYRNMKGEEFRFVDNKEYKILNPAEPLIIYVYQNPVHSTKGEQKYVPVYFFSTDAASPPQPLTKANLKAAFPDNHTFHDKLDEQFKADNELYAYDNFHKIYKLNRLLQNSNK